VGQEQWFTEGGSLTFGRKVTKTEVGHCPEPEAAVRVGGAIIASEPRVVLLAELCQVLVLACLAIEHGHAILEPDEDLVLRLAAPNVGRHGYRHVELERLERVWAFAQRYSVDLLFLDVHKTQRIGILFEVGALAETAVEVHVRFSNMPLLYCVCHGPCFLVSGAPVLQCRIRIDRMDPVTEPSAESTLGSSRAGSGQLEVLAAQSQPMAGTCCSLRLHLHLHLHLPRCLADGCLSVSQPVYQSLLTCARKQKQTQPLLYVFDGLDDYSLTSNKENSSRRRYRLLLSYQA